MGYRTCGALLVARDADEAAHVEREREQRERLGLRVERLLGSEARRREPALAPGVRLALELPDDHAVEPARVVAALAEACRRAGVQRAPGTPSRTRRAARRARRPRRRRVVGGVALPVRPVKGQALRLRDPAGPGLCDHVLRFEGGYLVPRGDGRYYLGATVEEQGFDTSVTALGVYELLREAAEVIPGVLELEIEEAFAGLRPGTPDNAPIVGTDPADERIVWATGHFRNGILLDAADRRARRRRADRRAARPRAPAGALRRGGDHMIYVNGEPSDAVAPGASVSELLEALDVPDRGVAVAVDAEVVPRSEWSTFAVDDEARVEVLIAVQGG